MLLPLLNSSILTQAAHSAEASLCTGPTMEEKNPEDSQKRRRCHAFRHCLGRTHVNKSTDVRTEGEAYEFQLVSSAQSRDHRFAGSVFLRPVNRLCCLGNQIFSVHLQIRRKSVWKWFDYLAFSWDGGHTMDFRKLMEKTCPEMFSTRKTLRR